MALLHPQRDRFPHGSIDLDPDRVEVLPRYVGPESVHAATDVVADGSRTDGALKSEDATDRHTEAGMCISHECDMMERHRQVADRKTLRHERLRAVPVRARSVELLLADPRLDRKLSELAGELHEGLLADEVGDVRGLSLALELFSLKAKLLGLGLLLLDV